MGSINQVKQSGEADTPLLLFQVDLPSGDSEYWSTQSLLFGGNAYVPRVLGHNLFDLQLSADDAMDGISKLSLSLANADSLLSELNNEIGFKGAKLTVYFVFADLSSGAVTTESTILFRGIAGDPDEITEEHLKLTFTNRLSLQRIGLPDVRVQRSCPWSFPTTQAQRAEAVSGGALGSYSKFYRCGYSADIVGGRGNLSNGQPFTSCDQSRAQCEQRGMFNTDNSGRSTKRFGGLEFVPSATLVRTHGDKTSHLSAVLNPAATYNDAVPMVYGTGWLSSPVVFTRNDGNLTHIEALLGLGPISPQGSSPQSILKVVVNDIEIPQGVAGQNMTSSGWYNLISNGAAEGNFDLSFVDTANQPVGDPFGSLSVLSVAVPNRICSGKSTPHVEVLMQGLLLPTANFDGSLNEPSYTNNPAWIVLDILRRCGWSTAELNLSSFFAAATYCQSLITTTDINGTSVTIPRYQCNLILTTRKSAAEIVRGIRVASSLMLRYGANGLLELIPESTIAEQNPESGSVPDGGNSSTPLAGGWPTYELSDSSAPFSGIVRNAGGASTVRLSSRSISETSNRLSVEFQDQSNEYQQDSLSLVDSVDSALIGYEISSHSTALGISNYSQATRVLLRQLRKSTTGNLFIQLQTSFRALKVRPGDIITVTYQKEGFVRRPFRVTKLSPSTNYELVTILAQTHDDTWYSDDPGVLANAGRQPGAQIQTPKPLLGTLLNPDGSTDFGVQETIQQQSDGTATAILSVAFVQPTKPAANAPSLPLLSLACDVSSTSGTLPGGTNYYYAVTAVDPSGNEGALSFTVYASVPSGTTTNSVTLKGLSLPSTCVSFNVYRGPTPQSLLRIATNVGFNLANPIFTDAGLTPLNPPCGPPDSSFDHANFYYRMELTSSFLATVSSATTIGNSDMGSVAAFYSGMMARIVAGTGVGQERQIVTNDATTLTVAPGWLILPDSSSQFVVTEASWRFAAVSNSSPARFQVPYQPGTFIEISGRAANVNNQEGDASLCPISRTPVGGTASDADTPGAPSYSLAAPGQGNITLSQVSFTSLTNTASVTSGTLQLFYWDELQTPTPFALGIPMDTLTNSVSLNGTPAASPGDVIQVGLELMTVLEKNTRTSTYTVDRTQPAGANLTSHNVGDLVYHLGRKLIVVPFAPNFFENRAAMNYLHTVDLPDVRVVASQMFVTNAFGNSATTTQTYIGSPAASSVAQGVLRTLAGGQISIQVSGSLAVQQNAAPPFLIDRSYAVRDIWATVSQAPGETDINLILLQNGTPYGPLIKIPAGGLSSGAILYDWASLPPLLKNSTLTLNIIQVGQAAASSPGRDLTLTIRL